MWDNIAMVAVCENQTKSDEVTAVTGTLKGFGVLIRLLVGGGVVL
jgi:hypothetical protein